MAVKHFENFNKLTKKYRIPHDKTGYDEAVHEDAVEEKKRKKTYTQMINFEKVKQILTPASMASSGGPAMPMGSSLIFLRVRASKRISKKGGSARAA